MSGLLFGNYAEDADAGWQGHGKGNWGMSILDALKARIAAADEEEDLEGGRGTRTGADAKRAAKRAAERAASATVRHVAGCDGPVPIACQEQATLPAAVAAAKDADATIVVLGLAFNKHCEPPGGGNIVAEDYCEREGTDRAFIELPAGQAKLVLALRAAMPAGKPLIGVMVHGGAIALGKDVIGALDALVDAWQPGIGGGEAVAGALFGDFSPSGRSPVTWYNSTADLPPLGHMGLYPVAATAALNNGEDRAGGGSAGMAVGDGPSNNTKGITYRYYEGSAVQFPFGFGLSGYTTFEYGPTLAVNATKVKPCEGIGVTVNVSNTGKMDSDEVVQLYVTMPRATVPAPLVRLAAFERVHVKAGETVAVSLVIAPEAHTVVLEDPAPGSDFVFTNSASVMVEEGELRIFVGGGQPGFAQSGVQASVAVTGTAALASCG